MFMICNKNNENNLNITLTPNYLNNITQQPTLFDEHNFLSLENKKKTVEQEVHLESTSLNAQLPKNPID